MALSLHEKLLYTFYTMVIYFVVANPFVYGLVDNLATSVGVPKGTVATGGCPTQLGVLLHTLVFGLLLLAVMELSAYYKKDKKD